jgi:predicted nuclease of restriction endonuclease-like RecB superfamily
LLASAAWRGLEPGAGFDRDRVVRELAERRALDPEAIDALLYADLRSAQIVRSAPKLSPTALVDRWERAQAQAVLLRAERVIADVRCRQPAAYRSLFAKLKFRRLLHRIQRLPAGGYRIEIDGPYSLFESVTKYGLELALILPALEECDELKLTADVRWGKEREPLRFKLEGRGGGANDQAPRMPDEVAALVEGFRALDGDWLAAPASEILDFPGIGLCVPDLEFRHRPSGVRVWFEALGFWSRDAVWRRIELAEKGLLERMLFAVSSRLRVSSELLDGVESAALYVYKGAMSVRAVERQLERLRAAIPLEKAGRRR